MESSTTRTTPYEQIIDLLDTTGARYSVLEHVEEGNTEKISALRGNRIEQAAKCIVVRVGVTKKKGRYVIAVVPGHLRVDIEAIREHYRGVKAMFAPQDMAESLTGAVSGSIPPFSFDPDVALIVDPELLREEEMYFNAARLDRSLRLSTADYLTAARPDVLPITEAATAPLA
ncbi:MULTISPECIES: YbaK/EbsC family protein [unclassified Streptomyces]|uniref:YbaK/EbsC family protein n=1 Tax=unclassified Streptomyces TaxID=2593676 RepID=UPI0033B20256